MIKRRFYRHEHGERDDPSDSESSPSSDSDLEAQTSDASEAEAQVEADDGHHQLPLVKSDHHSSSSSSGYESEHSSADEIEADSPCLLVNGDEIRTGLDGEKLTNTPLSSKVDGGITEIQKEIDPLPDDVARCVLKCKSVFKCRLCPKIVCLNDETLRAHLKSKRHARSEKLLNDGRLKRVLNSDGEEVVLDEEGETHAERHARILALAQDEPKKKGRGRQRQRQRHKRKKGRNDMDTPIPSQEVESLAKRRRKNA
ncbi:hypothetical protein Ancab_034815 [Ancistrocladus abbreviatus]